MANNKIQQNKDNMLSMIAITEDITRTTNRLYEVLYNLMSNPGDIKDIKNSIDDLTNKIKTLKDVTIEAPLMEKENVIVPGLNDASPLEDLDYVPPVMNSRNLAKIPKTKKSLPTESSQQRKLTTKRPNKSSKVKRPPQKVQKKVFTKKPYNKKRPSPDTTN